MNNDISNQINSELTNIKNVSSLENQLQITDQFSSIQQNDPIIISEDSQSSTQSNNSQHRTSTISTSLVVEKEDVEIEIRKRVIKDEKSGIWNSYKLVEISKEGERIWELSKIFTNPHPGASRLYYTNDFKSALENTDKQWLLECIKCKERFIFYSSARNSPKAIEHYQNVHAQLENDGNEAPPAKRKYGKVLNGNKKTNELNALVAATIITAKLPHSFVENDNFRALVNQLQSDRKEQEKYEIPCKKSFAETIIPQMKNTVLKTVTEDICDVKGVMATLDGWTTRIENDSFLSFTLHYMKNNEMKKRVLKMSDLCPSHKSDDIKYFIETTIEEFGLKKYSPIVILTDNAPNVIKAVNDSGNISIGCSCHRIQNVIKKVMNECNIFRYLVEKCTRISNSFKRNGEWNNLLKEVQKEIYEKILKPKSNVNTRWFSNLEVMKRILEIKDTIDGVINAFSLRLDVNVRENFIKDNTFDANEVEMIEYFVIILDKLQSMSNMMSSDEFPSLSLLIPEYQKVIRELDKEIDKFNDIDIDNDYDIFTLATYSISTKDEQFDNYSLFEESHISYKEIINYDSHQQSYSMKRDKLGFIQCIKSSMIEKFENENNIYENEIIIFSTILNPNNKFDIFEDDNEFERVKTIIELKLKEFIDEKEIQMNREGRKSRSKRTSELETYIEEECLNNASLKEIVNYWISNKDKYKMLFKMSEKYLYLIASSTSSERLFSNASGFYSEKRTLLTPSHLEESCIVHSWLINEGFDIFENINFESK